MTRVTLPTKASIAKALREAEAADFCRQGDEHTPVPGGYIARAEWMEKKAAEGWTQSQCPGCGRWAIWHPPAGKAPSADVNSDPEISSREAQT